MVCEDGCELESFELQSAGGRGAPRRLFYKAYGAPLSPPPAHLALYFHGTPSCHCEAEVLAEDAAALGVALISMDRAGVGLSTYNKNSTVASVADDAKQLLDHLGVAQAIVIGTSGGGPYAAAFAALFPEQALSLTLIAALAPTDKAHKGLLRSLSGPDRLQFSLAKFPVGGVWALHGVMRYMAMKHPKALLDHAPEGMAAVDGELLRGNEDVRAGFKGCLQHAYKHGSKGMARDVRALSLNWNVDISTVKCRTVIWQGEQDISVPAAHARWYADTISGSTLNLLPDEGHVTVLVNQAKAILESALPQP